MGGCRNALRDATEPTAEGNRAMRLTQIQDQIGRGEYRVDTQAVADAIIRRLIPEQRLSPVGVRLSQTECS